MLAGLDRAALFELRRGTLLDDRLRPLLRLRLRRLALIAMLSSRLLARLLAFLVLLLTIALCIFLMPSAVVLRERRRGSHPCQKNG